MIFGVPDDADCFSWREESRRLIGEPAVAPVLQAVMAGNPVSIRCARGIVFIAKPARDVRPDGEAAHIVPAGPRLPDSAATTFYLGSVHHP